MISDLIILWFMVLVNYGSLHQYGIVRLAKPVGISTISNNPTLQSSSNNYYISHFSVGKYIRFYLH